MPFFDEMPKDLRDYVFVGNRPIGREEASEGKGLRVIYHKKAYTIDGKPLPGHEAIFIHKHDYPEWDRRMMQAIRKIRRGTTEA